MAKNRKRMSAAVRFGPALKVFLLCALVAGSGVGYVWQKNQINLLGQQRSDREKRLDYLRRKNESLARTLASLQTHREIEAQLKQMNIDLVPPQPDQIVRLQEGPALVNPETGERLYAEGQYVPLQP